MSSAVEAFDLLAQLVRYPRPGVTEVACRAVDAFGDVDPAMGEAIGVFSADLKGLSFEAIEERYTRTFDMDAACALEAGWHLFGESYDRGLFLVWTRQQMREFGLDEGSDLPDHVGHGLRIVARLDDERATSFARLCLLPALSAIQPGLVKHENCYAPLFEAIADLLTNRFGPAVKPETMSLPVLTEHEELFSLEGV